MHSSGLGSVTESLDTSGNVTAQQLYAPYGRVRYQVGTLPTTKGYPGQRQDVSSGLNDDAARCYDASTAQFASADTASDAGNGLDRLAYVGGNPETLTDPTGHSQYCGVDCGGSGTGTGTGSGSGSGGSGCYSDANCGGGYSGNGQSGGNGTTLGCGECLLSQSSPNGDCVSQQCATHPLGPVKACEQTTSCGYGDDPNGLFSLIADELGGNFTTLVGVGIEGLKTLIGLLVDLEGRVKDNLDSLIFKLQVGGTVLLGGTFTVCTILCFALGASGFIDSLIVKSVEDRLIGMIEGVKGKLQHILTQYDNAQNKSDFWANKAQFVITAAIDPSIGYAPGDTEWWDESLSGNTYIYDW